MRKQHAFWWTAVIGVVVVEVLLAGSRRLDDAADVLRGELTAESLSGLLGLVWLPVLVVAFGLGGRRLTRLRRAQRISEQVVQVATATCRDWAWTAGPDLVITASNDRVQDLLGWSASDVVGRPTHALLAEHDDAVRAVTRQGLRDRAGWADVTTRWRHRDGAVVELTGSASCILGHHGEVVAVQGIRRAVDTSASQQADRDRRRAALRRLLSLGDLEIALQPIVDVTSSEVVGAEALARFRDGRAPDVWFREAAAVGLGVELELLAIREALELHRRLPERAYLSVNASPEALLDPRTTTLLQQAALPLHRVVVEITEHVGISRYDELIAALKPLRAAGLRLAVDDAGAGYASFQHILRLHPEIIKLDRSLIADIQDDDGRRAFVTAVVIVGLQLGARVTAEGVETTAELSTVTDLGVDSAQGYLLGRPALALTDWTATLSALTARQHPVGRA